VHVDFPEILSAIAPRALLVVAPKLDWHHPQGSVAQAIQAAKTTTATVQPAKIKQMQCRRKTNRGMLKVNCWLVRIFVVRAP